MQKKALLVGALALLVLATGGIFLSLYWHHRHSPDEREEMLSLLPTEPTTVVFLDLAELRSSAFLPQLLDWAPAPEEEDYVKFVGATGFHYERDLDRVALAFTRQTNGATVFAIADGRFDRGRMEAYAAQSGERIRQNGLTIVALQLKNSTHKIFFTFLRDGRIAWTSDRDYTTLFRLAHDLAGKRDWEERFARLGGTAVFAVMRQDAVTAETLVQQTPGGFRSPQLAGLLSQLQWITIGGKPQGSDLRVVAEGECSSETTIRQLKDFLGGMVVLAQVGLNDPKNRKQMDPQLREAYLDLLKTAEVEDVNRGTDKSVRLVLQITPEFLKALEKASTAVAGK